MPKKEERARIAEAVKECKTHDEFQELCEEDGFTVCCDAEESTGKKKANV